MNPTKPKRKRRYFGMTSTEIGILGAIGTLMLCVMIGGGFVVSRLMLTTPSSIQVVAQPTYTPLPTYTPFPTFTSMPPTFTLVPPTATSVLPTSTPLPANTRAPTNTPIPTVTPTSAPKIEVKKLGPIRDSSQDETFTAQISLNSVRFTSGGSFSKPKAGYIFVIVEVTVKNLGPSPMRSVGGYEFQVRDSNGALRDSGYVSEAYECRMDSVDLTANGSISGCIGFEVPIDGALELIYAPYKYEGLQPGRYLSFKIR